MVWVCRSGKKPYETRSEANEAIASLRRRGLSDAHSLRAYRCDCAAFHVDRNKRAGAMRKFKTDAPAKVRRYYELTKGSR